MPVIKKASVWIAMLIPPVAFYVLLARSLVSVPIQDDYHAILGFLLQWKNERGIKHILEIMTYQHNDYRFMFENTIVAIQYTILGHTNLEVLSIMGDLFVIPLFGILYLMWRECGRPREYTLLALVPVSWILFQLQYESTLNLATPALQFIPVLVFALLTCFLATKASKRAFLGTLLSVLLCVASCANGLFLLPIGAIIYLQRREFWRLLAWCSLSATVCLIYFHRYDFTAEMPNTHMGNNVLSILHHLSLVYAAAFWGSIAALRNPLPAVLFGIVLAGAFVFATYDRLFARRPALYYSSLFLFVTGLAVSGIRSTFGLVSAVASRYRINSAVLLILLYLYLADKLYGIRLRPLFFKVGTCIAAALLAGFTFVSDCVGEKLLLAKRNAAEVEMQCWEQHEPRHIIDPAFTGDLTAENERNGLFDPVEPFLSETIHEGIYILPGAPTESR
jgi:hypothetical protein